MGILRADRITGLGGANAIKGSVKFTSGGSLEINLDGATIGTSNFTLEAWVFWFGNYYHQLTGTESTNFNLYINNDDGDLVFYDGSTSFDLSSSNVKPNEWTHIALVREGTSTNETKVYINGTNTQNITVATNFSFSRLAIGAANFVQSNVYGNGYTSNLRFTLDAVYTSAFTPPNNELTLLDNTIVLCCQSPGNIFQEATGKTISSFRNSLNSADAQASHFTPNSPVGFSTTTDVGSQYGSTFDGFGSFATSTYMVPPGGNTRERNRGRAVFGGGESPTADNVMEYLNIQSGGRTIDFGDHSATTPSGDAVASSTRGVFTVHNSPANTNALEFITIANTGNSQDFGDQNTGGISQEAAASNSTRGLFAGGIFPGSQVHDTTEYITIATLGNAINFGNLIADVTSNTGVADATRALFAGGIGPGSPFPTVDRIEYFTIATTGNATDFGDLTYSARYPSSAGDSTRGVFMGGATPSATNTMCFVTIQTTGDATDFGDLVTASHDAAATSDSVRAIMGAGGTPSNTNTIEKLTIQTTGNATDHGDLSRQVSQLGACSDSHGGIS